MIYIKMGGCESKNNRNNIMPKIFIDKKNEKDFKNDKEKKEVVIPGNANYISNEKFNIIKNQKEKSICKIIKKGKPFGTGFLCSIIGEYKKRRTLITVNHVLGEEDLKIGNEIKITFNDNNEKINKLKIDNLRLIYSSEIEDITIIEIINADNLRDYNILEIDENIYNNNIDFKDKYNNKSIYILHYPKFIFSDNIIINIDKDNTIYHLCSTDNGSPGAPILSLDTLKVIGVHQGYEYFDKDIFNGTIINQPILKDNKILCNIGKIIKKAIFNFNKENKIVLTLKINKEDINNKVYFLQDFDIMKRDIDIKNIENHKININNYIILINDKIYESKRYFEPKTEGIYYIKIFMNHIIADCFGLFYECRNIINIDLSSFDTKNVTDMSSMFSGCSNLTNINLSSFDTKNVTDMSSMFSGCSNLTNINLSSFDTKNVTNLSFMFSSCLNLTNIDLSSFDTKNVTDMRSMFSGCSNLTNINLSSFDT